MIQSHLSDVFDFVLRFLSKMFQVIHRELLRKDRILLHQWTDKWWEQWLEEYASDRTHDILSLERVSIVVHDVSVLYLLLLPDELHWLLYLPEVYVIFFCIKFSIQHCKFWKFLNKSEILNAIKKCCFVALQNENVLWNLFWSYFLSKHESTD